MGFAIFAGGKYLVVIATGFTPNTFIEDDIVGGDVIGTLAKKYPPAKGDAKTSEQ